MYIIYEHHLLRFLLDAFIVGFNKRELRLIRTRPYSSLLTVTHMSHNSSQPAVSSADSGSRDLNAHFYTHIRINL